MFISNSFTVISENFDLKLRGDLWEKEFDIFNYNKLVANIRKKNFTVNDRYKLKIYDDKYKLYLLIVILIDDCLRNE